MQMNRSSKLKVLLPALIFSGALVLAPTRHVHAEVDPLGILAIGVLVGTYLTVMSTICTPVAAIKASNRQGGFGSAFGDCLNWQFSFTQPDPVQGEPNQAEQQTGPVKSPLQEVRLVDALDMLSVEDGD